MAAGDGPMWAWVLCSFSNSLVWAPFKSMNNELRGVGINALIYYSPTLFGTMGLDYSMQLIMSGVLNVTQLIGVTTSLITMDRFGRRPLLLWGSFFMFISHFIIAILVGKFSDDWPNHKAAGWVSVAFLLFYMLSFGSSWGPVPCESSCLSLR